MAKLEKLRELMEQITPGKWSHSDRWVEPPGKIDPIAYCGTDDTGYKDAKFIVIAHDLLPQLIAIAEAAQKVVRHETGSFDLLTDAVRGIEK